MPPAKKLQEPGGTLGTPAKAKPKNVGQVRGGTQSSEAPKARNLTAFARTVIGPDAQQDFFPKGVPETAYAASATRAAWPYPNVSSGTVPQIAQLEGTRSRSEGQPSLKSVGRSATPRRTSMPQAVPMTSSPCQSTIAENDPWRESPTGRSSRSASPVSWCISRIMCFDCASRGS